MVSKYGSNGKKENNLLEYKRTACQRRAELHFIIINKENQTVA